MLSSLTMMYLDVYCLVFFLFGILWVSWIYTWMSSLFKKIFRHYSLNIASYSLISFWDFNYIMLDHFILHCRSYTLNSLSFFLQFFPFCVLMEIIYCDLSSTTLFISSAFSSLVMGPPNQFFLSDSTFKISSVSIWFLFDH